MTAQLNFCTWLLACLNPTWHITTGVSDFLNTTHSAEGRWITQHKMRSSSPARSKSNYERLKSAFINKGLFWALAVCCLRVSLKHESCMFWYRHSSIVLCAFVNVCAFKSLINIATFCQQAAFFCCFDMNNQLWTFSWVMVVGGAKRGRDYTTDYSRFISNMLCV